LSHLHIITKRPAAFAALGSYSIGEESQENVNPKANDEVLLIDKALWVANDPLLREVAGRPCYLVEPFSLPAAMPLSSEIVVPQELVEGFFGKPHNGRIRVFHRSHSTPEVTSPMETHESPETPSDSIQLRSTTNANNHAIRNT
jgi:hypothetical protein